MPAKCTIHPMANPDLAHRFNHHPPKSQSVAEGHGFIREECLALAEILDRTLLVGREKALALTKLEEVMFWANAAIARNQWVGLTDGEPPPTTATPLIY